MTTKHRLQRAKERFGYNSGMTEHLVRNAIERGKRIEEYAVRTMLRDFQFHHEA